MADPTLAVLILAAIAHLALLAVLFRRGRWSGVMPRALMVYTALSLAWTAVQVWGTMEERSLVNRFDLPALQRIAYYFLPPLAFILLQLACLFERKKTSGPRWQATVVALLAMTVFLFEARPAGSPNRAANLLALALLVGSWVGFSLAAVAQTVFSRRGRISPLHRNRNSYWTIALALMISGQALFLFRQPLAGSLLHGIGLFTGCFAQLTHQLPDLRTAARRGAGFTIVAILAIALYTAGYAVIQAAVQPSSSAFQPLWGGAILALIMVALVNPLLGALQRRIRRSVNRSRYDANQMLSEYSLSISNILNLEYLAMVVVGIIGQAMEISHGALVIVHYEPPVPSHPGTCGSFTLRMISESGQYLGEGRLPETNPLVMALRFERQPLTLYDIDLLSRFKSMDANERSWLDSLDIDVYVPIYSGEAWIGLLALGPKVNHERFYKEDLSLLQTLADQTAIALENARLYEDLKQRNTENEILNAELKQANKELARLDEAKSDFITIASHELRTPLTQIIGYNDILGEIVKAGELNASDGEQMIDSVRKAAHRLEEIVETMLDLSKLESNMLDLHCNPVSLAPILNAAIDAWKPGLAKRKQTVTVHGIAHLPQITCDEKRLVQVFSNLIQNAIKYTPDGGHIRITGRQVEPPTGEEAGAGLSVEVIVEDNGIGIAAEDLERIFQKFYRVGNVLLHSSGDTKFKGAGPGLGLTIARGIVEAHGGKIWAESGGFDEVLRPGVKFHVILPLQHPERIPHANTGGGNYS
jgi:signal transduction histidine kinase/uncharacterized membrane protein YhaH (DUF805 family)